MRHLIMGIVLLSFTLSCSKNKGNDDHDYKMAKIYYGFGGSLVEFTVSYSGNNISELTGIGEKFTFSYDASDNLLKKERFNTITNSLLKKETLEYNSVGQVINHKIYSYETNTSGELTFNRDYLYANSKLSGTKVYAKGPSQTVNYKEVITWENEDLFTVATYDQDDARQGCLTDTKFIFDLQPNSFNNEFPKFRFLDLHFGINASYVFLGKNTLNRIEYPCQQQTPSGTTVFTYKYDSRGLITDVYENGIIYWRLEYR